MTMASEQTDREQIIELIHRNRIGIWTNDFDLWDSCFAHTDYMTRWGWWRGGGPYIQRGWADISARVRAEHPEPNLESAYKTTIEDLSLQIRGDTAWATFIQQYPGQLIPDHVGPGRRLEMRIFERHNGEWQIVLIGVLDADAGAATTSMLRLDSGGRVLWASPAAAATIEADDDLALRAGVLHFRDRRADRQLRDALAWVGTIDKGYVPRHGSRPIVVEAGEGLPTKVYWVMAEAGMILFAFGPQKLDERRLSLAAAVYGLSPAQVKIAALVAEGLTLPEIATRMGVTVNTARTHLDRVFDKVGVRTQPALVRVLLLVVAPI
jgi:DNA-binding CsgD family transcriptional regulator